MTSIIISQIGNIDIIIIVSISIFVQCHRILILIEPLVSYIFITATNTSSFVMHITYQGVQIHVV